MKLENSLTFTYSSFIGYGTFEYTLELYSTQTKKTSTFIGNVVIDNDRFFVITEDFTTFTERSYNITLTIEENEVFKGIATNTITNTDYVNDVTETIFVNEE